MQLMPVWVGLIKLNFVSPHWLKAEYILTTMNEELLVASVLFVQSGAILVSHNGGFIKFFKIVQC